MNRKMFVRQKSSGSKMETLLILLLWASLSEGFNPNMDQPLVFEHTPQGFCLMADRRNLDNTSQSVPNTTTAYQECTKREVNLVFMLDGSSSLSIIEFEMSKQFIIEIMKKLSNSHIKFAAVQFGGTSRTVFDFNDYQNGTAEQKLKAEKQIKSFTYTYIAIKYILDNLLNDTSSGSNPNAQKALVIITDGQPTDMDSQNIIQKCDEQNILRYIIGVGTIDLKMLKYLASEPKQNNTFYIQDYKGLEGLVDNLQNKIYNIRQCTTREVNLVFMVDGSRSMRKEEFEMNKQFITDIMKKLSNSHIKFAAVQFGAKFSTVFDFNDYQNGTAEQKLKAEKHMQSLTNTYGAIKYILDNLLNDESSGSNPNAQKALVIITDGHPTDLDIHNIIRKCNEQKILRYIIGVGTVDSEMLKSLASEPKQNNTFYIQDYRGLEGLLDNLQNKIYNIEGHSKVIG